MQDEQSEEESAAFPVQDARLFSESLIWDLQRRFYERHGIEAWGQGRIPFGISTSPHIGAAYARVLFGYLRDWAASLDPSEPVYVIELGAGSGRLGFNVLNALASFFDDSALKDLRFTYVLTDFVEQNVAFWEQHPSLRPFVEQGRLDFARFDVMNDRSLRLRASGKVLEPGSVANPVAVFANYLFDSIPQDLFSVEDGEIFAVTVALTSAQEEPDLSDPELITRVQMEYDRHPVDEDFYGDEASRRILAFYRDALDGTIITFPQTVLRCIDALRELSGGRMLLLSGDKGDHRLEDYQGRDLPALTLHDTGFSITFNYHALSRYFEDLGGQTLSTSFRATSLNILAFILGAPSITETRQAYRDFIDLNSPDDNYTGLISAEQNQDISLVELMALIRMKRYDHHGFLLVWPQLSKKLQGMPAAAIPEIRQMVARIWANYFELGEKHNLPFHLGVLLAAIGDYADSVIYFERSLARSPGHTTTLFNLANSLMHLGRTAEALAALDALPADQQQRPEVESLRQRIAGGEGSGEPRAERR